MDQNPEYGILVTGYSLGAGICQLVAMELLEKQPNVRCISYGAPLVFEADLQGYYLFSNCVFMMIVFIFFLNCPVF